MIKYTFAVMLGLISLTAANAQRLIPKQKGLELNAGLLSEEVKRNYYLNMTMTINGKNGSYWLLGAEYTHQQSEYKKAEIPLDDYLVEAGYSVQLLGDARKTITLNAGLTAIAGYENINHSKIILNDGSQLLDKDNFVYGTGGRLCFEIYLSNQFVLLLQGRTKILWGTDLKQLRPSTGIGLRFNF